ncbi:MAG: hypothetical protein ACRD1X_06525 [Vicinamibacteria bacterium]
MLKTVLATIGLVSVLACEAAPSDVVNAFVEATRTGDLATLATVSVVGWPDQRVRASDILAWWITRITASEDQAFELDERQQRLNAARDARDARLLESGEGEDAELVRIQSRVERLRAEIEREREEARKSVETWAPIDEFQGGVETRRAEVIVRSPTGDYHYALTLKRYRLSRSAEASPFASRWIVTAIEPL